MTTPPARILIIEDDPDQSMLFAQVLSMGGYQVQVAGDAEMALGYLAQSAYNLLLVDWDLPVMTGDALINLVKVQYPASKTVLFSNHMDVDRIAADCGADAWFRKSDDIFRLRKMIAELLDQPARRT